MFRLVRPCLVPDLELADSITLDPHKGLFLPYGSGGLLLKRPELLLSAHQRDADYLRDLSREEGAPSFTDLSPELSRAFRGLCLWLPLKLHGAHAFRNALAEKMALCRQAYDSLSRSELFEMLDEPQLSVVAFRLKADDEANSELLRRVNDERKVFLSSTTLRGKITLRICVLCFRSEASHVAAAVDALVRHGRVLVSELGSQ